MYLYTFHILLIYIREDKILQTIIYLFMEKGIKQNYSIYFLKIHKYL